MQWNGNRLAALNKARVSSLAFCDYIGWPLLCAGSVYLAWRFCLFGGMGEHLESVLKPRALGLPGTDDGWFAHILSSRLRYSQ